jgi:hypothetical protein
VPEVAEGVLGKSTAGVESAVIEPPPRTDGETKDAPLLRPAEAAETVPTPSMVGAVEKVIKGPGPSPPSLLLPSWKRY